MTASGAEQDRFGSHFGDKAPSASQVNEYVPRRSGAEQDIYASQIGGRLPSASNITDRLPRTSGAEQDIYASHMSGKLPSMGDISDKMPQSSGAEQDVYGGWFSGKSAPLDRATDKINENLPRQSGAEQDVFSGWFGGKSAPLDKAADKINENLPHRSGAEQDVFRGWFGGKSAPLDKAADRISERMPRSSGAEQDRFGAHFGPRFGHTVNPTAVGLLQSSILPSFGFHAGLSTIAYGVSRYTDRADGKDWLWPTGMTANAWWSAVGIRVVYEGMSIPQAWSALSYPEKLLLGGVSAWGLRLFYRVASRSVRRGKDDTRYNAAKEDPAFWNKAFFSMFMPEAVAQTLISLPFTLPFRATLQSASTSPVFGDANVLHSLAVFLFSTGYALEVLADAQLELSKQKDPGAVNREGTWSIVRHPNYLGDALIHASFPVLLLSAGILHPLALAGPIANYCFLRYIGGDKENEADQEARYKESPVKDIEFQEYKKEKNSFWPSAAELENKWTWLIIAAGAGGVVLERGFRVVFSD